MDSHDELLLTSFLLVGLGWVPFHTRLFHLLSSNLMILLLVHCGLVTGYADREERIGQLVHSKSQVSHRGQRYPCLPVNSAASASTAVRVGADCSFFAVWFVVLGFEIVRADCGC